MGAKYFEIHDTMVSSAKALLGTVISGVISTAFISYLQVNPLIELIVGGLLFLITYIAGVITLKILTPTDLNYMETIFNSLWTFSKLFTLFIQAIRKLSGYK